MVARDQSLAVRREGDRRNGGLVPFEAAQLLAAGNVPAPQRLVVGGGDNRLAVRAELYRSHPAVVPVATVQELARGEIPDADGLIAAARTAPRRARGAPSRRGPQARFRGSRRGSRRPRPRKRDGRRPARRRRHQLRNRGRTGLLASRARQPLEGRARWKPGQTGPPLDIGNSSRWKVLSCPCRAERRWKARLRGGE